jgi:hypothetical protein
MFMFCYTLIFFIYHISTQYYFNTFSLATDFVAFSHRFAQIIMKTFSINQLWQL